MSIPPMKFHLILLLIAGALTGLAGCAEYTAENRPPIAYAGRGGDKLHITPYPMSVRTANIWKSDACWRDCSANCTAKFNACGRTDDGETCRNTLDRCDRLCVFQCRKSGGPVLYNFEPLF
jgi:hypothetical protein